MKIISRKRKRQTAFITTLFICSFVSFFSQIQCTSNNIRLFARSVPLGYQPPPTPPLVEDVPVMQYKLYKPPSRFSHPSTNNLPTFKHVGDKEPLMVNTLIQVFGPNKGDISESEKQRLSSFMGEEGKSIEQNSPITTPPPNLNGQKRVTITRQLDTEGRTYVPENQTNSTTNPKIAIVKAFAASNSSQISEAQLREELGKELEQSVSLILDELGRKDKSKQHITSTQPVPNGEELERLEAEENEGQTTERSQKESENSILSTREAITEQQPSSISSSTVPPLLVFSKTKEPIEVLPATSITTAQNKKEEENISTVTPGDNEEQKEEIATTIETQTEENIVESKSTTITIAQLYKNSEEKIEAPIATTNAEEIQLTSTKNIKPEENELNKENQETPKEEENKGLVIEGSIIKSEKKTTTTTEEIGFAEEEIPSTELAPSAEEQKATEELTKTTSETLQNTENIQNIKEEEEEEIKEQQKTTNINVGGEQQQQQLGPGWQRTDFEEGQLWVQCKPPSIRALLWPWPSNRTFENGVLFAKDYHEESDCYAELDKDSGGGARLDIGPGKCGLSKNNNSQTPQNISVVLMFAPRRSLVIEGPEFSFLVQCYTPVLPIQQKYQQLTADLAIQKPLSNPVMTKTIELSQTPPRCEYSLRKNSPDGPLLQRATLGQTIYHRWECEGGQEVAEQFGLLLSDCVVANLTQESINNNNSSSSGKTSMVDLIDSEGCSTDTLIVNDPEYEKDNLVAYAKAKVFLLRPESHFLRFSCKLSLCLRQNDGCKGFTPPKCPPTNVSRLPSNNHHSLSEKTPSALSQQLISPQLVVNSEGITSSSSNTSPPRLPFHSSGGNKYLLVNSAWTIGLVLGVSILLGLFFGLATFLLHSQHRKNQQKRLVQWVLARPPSSSSSSSSQEAGYIGSRGINIEAIQQHSDDYLSTEENIRINTTTINSFPSCSSNSPKERNNN